jgi:hypothetical protein
MAYTYNGRNIQLNLEKEGITPTSAQWYNPRNGEFTEAVSASNVFDPPGEQVDGNDWVLLLKWK